ncbi:hypothetical protein PYCCODRAFT_1453186 [Trametes coccinea BRFM310]|uniref:Nitrate reductase [NADPH] n=1 Tax=Trametes coccinea (strain BRFM310) TaxID=1353009 RepID=A0A1Y2II11_TRAC3|nr:hypothetical protein PYCCODRAFT_1453186 [Trametes coccinea BRFM310]
MPIRTNDAQPARRPIDRGSVKAHDGEPNRRLGMFAMKSTDTNGPDLRVFRGAADDDAPGDMSWQDKLASPDTFASVRDVKEQTPDYKLENPKLHGSERFVLPVSEKEIQDQPWPGKGIKNIKHRLSTSTSPYAEQPKATPPRESVKQQNGLAGSGMRGNIRNALLPRDDDDFKAKLEEEIKTIAFFKNNPGTPQGDLKPLDGDALKQLARHVSIDDEILPDSWIPRSSELLRVTGKIPLNAEPNLTHLFEAGFTTPTKLHYVRTHGEVPQLSWEEHKLSVYSDPGGLVANPKEWSMDELAYGNYHVIEIPVTFGCDGTRRKEVNMLRKTNAFNWSAASISTALWRGVLVRDVLLACGLQRPPDHERWYVNFEGADELPNGMYATSIPLMHIMDPTNDVMLAFGMNQRVLHPDHGYPLRVVTPGYVGGRQVKWLKKMWITKKPNDSYYHIHDNRVLPSFIDSADHPYADLFNQLESTACWEQCLQSVTVKPAHNEIIDLTDGDGLDSIYTVRGYAFTGGGDRVDRVELSLDGGQSWRYCFRHFVEEPLRHGEKYWTWLFWSCDVMVSDLVNAFEIIVRAQDGRKNFQPEHITWNLSGMLNNAWYRVRPQIIIDEETGRPAVKFLHPVAPGNGSDRGWMTPPPFPEDPGDGLNIIPLDEVLKHNSLDDAWVILDYKVYDVTKLLPAHPGGPYAILAYAGKASVDLTNQFHGIHGAAAYEWRKSFLIGKLSDEDVVRMQEDAALAEEQLVELKKERKGLSLQPDLGTEASLVKRVEVSDTLRRYTFKLALKCDGSPGELGLPIGQHMAVAVHFKDKAVVRSYVPVRPILASEEDGTFDLLVQTYFPDADSVFPPGGTMTNYLDCMVEGESVDVRGPVGGIIYNGKGNFTINGFDFHFDQINLLAGSGGFTPNWQLIRTILSDDTDKTLISLIDCNDTFGDIMLRDELAKYAEDYADRFYVWHVLLELPEDQPDFECSKGPLTRDIMGEYFYLAGQGVATFVCGPRSLIEDLAMPGLEELGFVNGLTLFGF